MQQYEVMPMIPILELKNVECRLRDNTIIRKLSLHINKGAIACLLGPSGCGKTTLLRAIAGFEELHGGSILLRGHPIAQAGKGIPPEQRRMTMVFQDYALFPHLTINANVCFGIRAQEKQRQQTIAAKLLQLVELDQLGDRYPHELSGGQQQRVALARAMAPAPDLILMDEPFSNLDIDLRDRLRENVRDILKAQNTSVIMVTHDQQEAFAIGDVIGVMRKGQILQWDTPFNLYHKPGNRFIADFIGPGVFLCGTLIEPTAVQTELGLIQGDRAYQWPKHTRVNVLLRPDDVVVNADSDIRATVQKKSFKGAQILYTLQLSTGAILLSLLPSHSNYVVGENVGIRIQADHLVVFQSSDLQQDEIDTATHNDAACLNRGENKSA